MSETTATGRPVWYELLTTDVKAAEAFYTQVIPWTVTPFEGAEPPYDIMTTAAGPAAGPAAGMMTLPQGMHYPPHWGMYIGVPTLEPAVARAGQLGATALSPVIEVPKVGRLRTMHDPQGAMFSLFEPFSTENPPEEPAAIGHVSWLELYTTDNAAAMAFYTSMFGWTETAAFDMGPMGMYRMFARTIPLGGMMNKTPDMAQLPSAWGIYFRVADVDAAVAAVKVNGGQLLNGPMEVPGGDRVAQCMDPQGAAFSLHQRKS